MKNIITLMKILDGYYAPDTGRTVEIYNYHASDVAGSAPNGTKIGDCGEIAAVGQYEIDIAVALKVTVVVDSKCKAGLIGKMFDGETALEDSVNTAAIEDEAVTPGKTNFADAFSEV